MPFLSHSFISVHKYDLNTITHKIPRHVNSGYEKDILGCPFISLSFIMIRSNLFQLLIICKSIAGNLLCILDNQEGIRIDLIYKLI